MDINYKAKELEGERYAHSRDILLLRIDAEIDNSMDVVRRYGDAHMHLVTSYLSSSKKIKNRKVNSA